MTNVEIPDVMVNGIREIIEEFPELGYESVEEFVRESVRINIMKYGLV